ncbi:Xylanase inhibitor protein 1 [Dichanthelium oligosanthes]|uniref:Xylanase inhibitor protein 1 n=1 Tax=Dichanthelium oligosanthes TaxID=888268 RepID=A0A1E5VBY0_9POAL|nr:Xylanase inhibitor protein 1 [Dichanthelium oligosanthes]
MLPFLVVLLLAGVVASPAAAGKTEDLTVFWGRNKDEGSLREACDTGTYNTVIISFFSVFGNRRYWADLSGHDVSAIGDDVKHCQSARNVTVLLSVGGDGDRYSLPTARAARDVADHLWHAYLGGGRRGVFRPFGDAALDGVDFYIDHGGAENYDALARRLAGYRYDGRHGSKKKAVLLTATPRCMDGGEGMAGVDAALATGLFRRIHVRFYNDTMCSFSVREKRPFYGSWLGWTERYPEAKVYVGLPAAPDAASDGWVEPKAVFLEVMPLVQDTANYGGVMLWNRYYDKRDRYGLRIKLMV